MQQRYLALLRGINVGGNNRLPMKDLAAIFLEVGCADVQTYIQSGNVLFRAPARIAPKVAGLVSAKIEAQFGYKIPLIIRTDQQLRDALRLNPFLKAGAPEDALHLMFLAGTPAPERIALLAPLRSDPGAFHILGQEVYLHLPKGIAKTKLSNASFDAKLATISTVRNWRTVTTLSELMGRG